MDTQTLTPQNLEERLIYWAILLTYPIYLLGGLYLLAPMLGWSLAGMYLWRRLLGVAAPIPVAIWLWIGGMAMLAIALVFGHANWDLGLAAALKSSLGWAKGWALLAVFIVAGCLQVRPLIICKSAAWVCVHSIVYLTISLLAFAAGAPADLYVSPLKILGGSGPEYFAVSLYGIGYDGGLRWRLFAPWGPALGMVANVYLICCLLLPRSRLKSAALVGSVLMVIASKSRLAGICMLAIPCCMYVARQLAHPGMMFTGAAASTLLGLFSSQLLSLYTSATTAFVAARPESSRVRATLARMAVQRWQQEAPVWGHGIVEKGPHLVEYMPIGTHHTWFGLLFVKGAIGAVALALPMAWTAVSLLRKAQSSRTASAAFALVCLLFVYTFGENLESLAYLYWPGLILIGWSLRMPVPSCKFDFQNENHIAS